MLRHLLCSLLLSLSLFSSFSPSLFLFLFLFIFLFFFLFFSLYFFFLWLRHNLMILVNSTYTINCTMLIYMHAYLLQQLSLSLVSDSIGLISLLVSRDNIQIYVMQKIFQGFVMIVIFREQHTHTHMLRQRSEYAVIVVIIVIFRVCRPKAIRLIKQAAPPPPPLHHCLEGTGTSI